MEAYYSMIPLATAPMHSGHNHFHEGFMRSRTLTRARMHTHMQACIHTLSHTHIHMHTHALHSHKEMHTHIHAHAYLRTCIHVYTQMLSHTYTCAPDHRRAEKYTALHTHAHICAPTHLRAHSYTLTQCACACEEVSLSVSVLVSLSDFLPSLSLFHSFWLSLCLVVSLSHYLIFSFFHSYIPTNVKTNIRLIYMRAHTYTTPHIQIDIGDTTAGFVYKHMYARTHTSTSAYTNLHR